MMDQLVARWVRLHDELELDGSLLRQNGSHLGSLRGDRVSLGPDDGGVRGVPVEVDAPWLIVDGRQACYVGQENAGDYPKATKLHDGMVEWTGRFAVQPAGKHRPEIDGPLPEK